MLNEVNRRPYFLAWCPYLVSFCGTPRAVACLRVRCSACPLFHLQLSYLRSRRGVSRRKNPASSASQPDVTQARAAEVTQVRSTYVLGPDDQIVIRAIEAEEISEKPIRIDSTGSIRIR